MTVRVVGAVTLIGSSSGTVATKPFVAPGDPCRTWLGRFGTQYPTLGNADVFDTGPQPGVDELMTVISGRPEAARIRGGR